MKLLYIDFKLLRRVSARKFQVEALELIRMRFKTYTAL